MDLVIGRGELYFERLDPLTMEGDGERYLGNTPEFSTSRQVQTIAKFEAEDGQKVEVEGAIIGETHGARFTTDQVSVENLALWYASEVEPVQQAAATNVIQTIRVSPGRYYQLGTAGGDPHGVQNVNITRARIAGSVIDMAAHFLFEPQIGRIRVHDITPLISGPTDVEFRYDVAAETKMRLTAGVHALFGALRFISRAPVGLRFNHYYPLVKLIPTGSVDLKGPTWQTLVFDVEVRKRSRLHPYVHVQKA